VLFNIRRNWKLLLINSKNGHVQLTTITLPNIVLIRGYALPKTSLKELESAIKLGFQDRNLDTDSTLVVGDFNKALNTVFGQKLREFMKSIGMPSCLPTICSTTKAGTQIDCVFSGIPGIQVYISTSLTSHHDPIQVFIPKLNDHSCTDTTLEDLMKLNISESNETSYKASSQAFYSGQSTTVHQTSTQLGLNSSTQKTEISTSSLQPSQATPGLLNPNGRYLCFTNSSIQALKTTFEALENPQFTDYCLFSSLLELYSNMHQLPQPQIVSQFLKAMNTT